MRFSQEQIRSKDKDQKKKQRKARRGLLALLKRLRRLCGRFQSAQDWVEFIQTNLEPLLEEHKDALPYGTQQRLRNAARLTEATREGANQACNILQMEVQQVVPQLPGAPIFAVAAKFAAGLMIIAAIVAGAVVLAATFLAPRIEIINFACGTIPLDIPLRDQVPNALIPDEIPADGEAHTVRLIPGRFYIDTSRPNQFIVRMGDTPLSPPDTQIGDLDSILFLDNDNRRELLGQNAPIDLQIGKQYSLTLTCRSAE